MIKISPHQLEAITSELRSLATEGASPIPKAVQWLSQLGFSSVRYYQYCKEHLHDGEYLALARGTAMNGSQMSDDIGERIDFRKSLLNRRQSQLGVSDLPARCIYIAAADVAHPDRFIESAGALGCDHVLLPLRSRSRFVGEIACSLKLNGVSFDADQTLPMLQILASTIGRCIEDAASTRLEDAIKKFEAQEDTLIDSGNPQQILHAIAEFIGRTVPAAVTSVFSYSTAEDLLSKVAEYPANLDEGFDENYSPGEFLTGRAFIDEKYRYVANLQRLMQEQGQSDLICGKSLKRHKRLVDYIGGVAYEPIGQRDQKMLVRIFNRPDDGRIPFGTEDILALKAACESVARVHREIIYSKRLESLESTSTFILSHLNNVNDIARQIQGALAAEGIRHIICFGRNEDEQNITIYLDTLNHESPKGGSFSDPFHPGCTSRSPFLSTGLKAKGVTFEQLPDKDKAGDEFVATLSRFGYFGMLFLPTRSGLVSACIGIPIRKKNLDAQEVKQFPNALKKLLNAYTSILAGALSLSNERMTMESARILTAHIGHEIKSPMIEAVNESQELLSEITQIVERVSFVRKQLGDDIPQRLKQKERRIDDYKRGISLSIDVARGVTMSIDQDIEVNFREVDLFEIVQRCERRVQSDVKVLQGNRNVRVRFVYNNAIRSHQPIVADWFLLTMVIENLFTNAVKYSQIRHKGKAIEIGVNANPQKNMTRIEITNWGAPIEQHLAEKIFQPYFRGKPRDRFHASRGMGMGLYLARVFSKLHGGTVRLLSSVPTLDDDERRRDDGWLTTFELRLRTDLTPSRLQANVSASGQVHVPRR